MLEIILFIKKENTNNPDKTDRHVGVTVHSRVTSSTEYGIQPNNHPCTSWPCISCTCRNISWCVQLVSTFSALHNSRIPATSLREPTHAPARWILLGLVPQWTSCWWSHRLADPSPSSWTPRVQALTWPFQVGVVVEKPCTKCMRWWWLYCSVFTIYHRRARQNFLEYTIQPVIID